MQGLERVKLGGNKRKGGRWRMAVVVNVRMSIGRHVPSGTANIAASSLSRIQKFLNRSSWSQMLFGQVLSTVRTCLSHRPLFFSSRLFSTTSAVEAGYKMKSHSGAKKRWRSLASGVAFKRVSPICLSWTVCGRLTRMRASTMCIGKGLPFTSEHL